MPSSESEIEVINKDFKPRVITHALFDFDGTISWVREGWQGIMLSMMVEELLKTPQHESNEELARSVRAYIDELTGKQTMYQMLRYVEEIKKRGGTPRTALEYKHQYLELLEKHIADRIKDLEGGASPEEYLMAGARQFLEMLKKKGVVCYLASGTDQKFVEREAKLLTVFDLFESVWGASDDYLTFSKRIAIERIIEKNNVDGEHLVVFGDGYVEMEVARERQAVAVGVASDEIRKTGVDHWTRERLIKAGADFIISDFTKAEEMFSLLSA